MARKLEFNKAEKHVHNFMMDIQYAKEVRMGLRHRNMPSLSPRSPSPAPPPSDPEARPLLPEPQGSISMNTVPPTPDEGVGCPCAARVMDVLQTHA